MHNPQSHPKNFSFLFAQIYFAIKMDFRDREE